MNQEDAHNAIIDFIPNLSLFGVYDGHGGPEVAKWIANNIPDLLKEQLNGDNVDLDEKLALKIQGIYRFKM